VSDRGTGYEAYLDFLVSLHKSGAAFFVEGGQAVNFWAEYLLFSASAIAFSA
jgi:hypothetical protein